MSVVVAYTYKNGCLVAYDSAAVGTDIMIESITPKAVKHSGNGIVGAVGSWRAINMLNELRQENLSPQYVASLIKERRNEEDWSDTEIIFVSPGKPIVFLQTSGLSTIEVKSPFMAIGAGAGYAIGYLSGQKTIDETNVKQAVETAAKWSPYVIPPVKMLKLQH
jgi:ATP-dependent protease HslVU (ClpYQ) peptidase subunit